MSQRAGYRQPPAASRFEKGRSGNPRGRPRGTTNTPPYEAVLGQMVTVRGDGGERRLTAAEAFLLQITKKGLEGEGAAARAAIAAIEEARAQRQFSNKDEKVIVSWLCVSPGSVNRALEPLRMAVKHDSYRPTARIKLEPWLVEAALERLGTRTLAVDEQLIIVKATRTPHKVKWPEWWEVW